MEHSTPTLADLEARIVRLETAIAQLGRHLAPAPFERVSLTEAGLAVAASAALERRTAQREHDVFAASRSAVPLWCGTK